MEEGRLEWSDYPNAFERIAGSLDHRAVGHAVGDGAPGCEFEVPGGDAHVGGASHGGLHALESLSPVIVAGPTPVHVAASTCARLISRRSSCSCSGCRCAIASAIRV